MVISKICEKCKRQFLTDQEWKKICIPCYKIIKGHTNNTNNIELMAAGITDTTMLKRIIYLCHPDKHDQSEMSIMVTKYLLTLR